MGKVKKKRWRLLLFLGIVLKFLKWKRNSHHQNSVDVKSGEKILDVERIWQRGEGITHPNSACGPTSAAMVTKYFVDENRLTYTTQSNDMLVNELYKTMGTFPWGTHILCLQKQLARLLNRHTNEAKWRVKFVWANRRYGTFVQSIEEGNPVIIHFLFNFSKKTFASHHFVVGVGYRSIENRKLIAVLDPDAGEHNKHIHWLDWDKNEKYMNLLVINRKNK